MGYTSQIMNAPTKGAYSSQMNMGAKQPGEKVPSGYRKYAVQNFTPEQMDLFSQLFDYLGPESFLSKLAGGDESSFDELEAPALRQFNELQGGLASRFSGMGTGGRKSSGFQNASNAASQDFAGQLQSNRQGLQRQAFMDLMGLSEGLMNQRPYTTGLAEKRQDQNNGAFSALGESLGAIPGYLTGGKKGAINGATNTIKGLSLL